MGEHAGTPAAADLVQGWWQTSIMALLQQLQDLKPTVLRVLRCVAMRADAPSGVVDMAEATRGWVEAMVQASRRTFPLSEDEKALASQLREVSQAEGDSLEALWGALGVLVDPDMSGRIAWPKAGSGDGGNVHWRMLRFAARYTSWRLRPKTLHSVFDVLSGLLESARYGLTHAAVGN